MILNENVIRNQSERRLDIWQGPVTLDGHNLIKSDNMRYLGFELDSKGKNTAHISKRRSLTIAASMRLKSLGIYTPSTSPYIKSFLYKTYLRPILLYGFENICLKRTELLQIKRIEGNLVKSIIGISNRCRTSLLFLALGINSTEMQLMKMKLDFYERLLSNDFTKKFLMVLAESGASGDYIEELCEYTNDLNLDESTSTLLQRCKMKISSNEAETKALRKSPAIVEIKKILDNKNKNIISQLLSQALKFNAT